MLLAKGDRIGDWIVDETLGEGGMGAVYKCHNVLSTKIVAAVKVLKQHGLGDARERFLREVELLASVQHNAVVRVLGGGEDTDRKLLYMAMEFLEGEDLHHRLERGPLDWADAARMFQQLGAGLLAAHEKGVVHRDIKPQNILICKDGSAKLLDFGIAVQTGGEKLTREGAIPGTVSYMPPEVFKGKKPDHRADIYALGVVLWEALTGKEAYPHDPSTTDQQNMVRIMGQKLDADPLDPGPTFHPAVRKLVQEATRAEVDRRMRELGPFVSALREATGEVKAGTTKYQYQPEPARSGGSGGCMLAVVALIALLALTGVGVLAVGVLGGGALLFASSGGGTSGPVYTPTPEAPVPAPTTGWGGYTMPPAEVPDGFPFEVPKGVKIVTGMKTTSMGMTSYSVVYEIDDPTGLAEKYDKAFKARGLETVRSDSVDASGTTTAVTGWSMRGESATFAASPNLMGGSRYWVSLTWIPPSS